MDLKSIFATNAAPKTASEAPANQRPATSAASAVNSAIQDALNTQTKVASEQGPTASALRDMAGQVSAFEKQARVQEAHLTGRAMCDGFMAQLGVYEKVAGEMAPSHTQYQVNYEAEKRAAWEQEYAETVGQIEKSAAEHYLAGYHAMLGALQ